jgi:hypothetical protein
MTRNSPFGQGEPPWSGAGLLVECAAAPLSDTVAAADRRDNAVQALPTVDPLRTCSCSKRNLLLERPGRSRSLLHSIPARSPAGRLRPCSLTLTTAPLMSAAPDDLYSYDEQRNADLTTVGNFRQAEGDCAYRLLKCDRVRIAPG